MADPRSGRKGRCYIASPTLSVAVKFRIIETEPNLLARVYLYLPNKLDAGHRRIRPRYNITDATPASAKNSSFSYSFRKKIGQKLGPPPPVQSLSRTPLHKVL